MTPLKRLADENVHDPAHEIDADDHAHVKTDTKGDVDPAQGTVTLEEDALAHVLVTKDMEKGSS